MESQEIFVLLIVAASTTFTGYKFGFHKAKKKYQPPSKGSLHQPIKEREED